MTTEEGNHFEAG
jgi:Rhodopsin-like GPCR transmembrane domain